MELEKIIGSNVRRLRKLRGLKQPQLAALYECGDKYISQIENGRTWMGKDVFYKICGLLNAEPEDFIVPIDFPDATLIKKMQRLIKAGYADILTDFINTLADYEWIETSDVDVLQRDLEFIKKKFPPKKELIMEGPSEK